MPIAKAARRLNSSWSAGRHPKRSLVSGCFREANVSSSFVGNRVARGSEYANCLANIGLGRPGLGSFSCCVLLAFFEARPASAPLIVLKRLTE
jgi:hypothetical protein